jgi:hypothetical protein
MVCPYFYMGRCYSNTPAEVLRGIKPPQSYQKYCETEDYAVCIRYRKSDIFKEPEIIEPANKRVKKT